MKKLSKAVSKGHLRFSLPFMTYEVSLDDLLNSKSVDERIARLEEIKGDLHGAIDAVESLRTDAIERKNEVEELQKTIQDLQEDKSTTEALLKVPQESFSRVLNQATSKGRVRGIIEGSIIGFVTGTLSSFLVWYLTK